jgi:CheY-like chemotaxis protein/HPt (histidine-containing phosphotransfer) domain-containing protein
MVHDTGIGISSTDQGRIFEVFAQGDSSTTRQYGGTGLGLSITEQLVRLMRGKVWVDSTPGEGSTFHFTVRLERARAEDGEPAPVDPTRLRGLRVLVVDDNATNRRILGEMLSNWRLDPTLVDGAPAALTALEAARRASRPYHLVLLDAQMPGTDGHTLARRIRGRKKRGGPVLILLTSAGLHEKTELRRVGIHAALLKPVKQSDLLDTILTTLGRRSTGRERPPASPARPTRRLHVLVVEDNRVNQTLARRILEQRGHQVTMAENGRQALEALDRGRFDVVLMDVQMPVMNGLEATARIRADEQGGDRHLPIVAMTAHAMRGDRERCLNAGMDGYLVKPIQADEMIAALERFAGTGQARDPGGTSGEPAPADARTAMLDHLGGDLALATELARIFLEDRDAMVAGIERAIVARDGEGLRIAAHTLKGAVGNFGATTVAAAALRLEKAGASGAWKEATGAWEVLNRELAVLETLLHSLAPSPSARPRTRSSKSVPATRSVTKRRAAKHVTAKPAVSRRKRRTR